MPSPRREARSKSCSICGQPAAPGARLCVPCKSAIKRARDTTVSEQMVPARRARRRPVPSVPTAATAEVAAPAPRPARWIGRAAIAFAALGVIATAGAWLAYTRGNAGTIAPRYSVVPVDPDGATIHAPVTDLKATSTAAAPTPDAQGARDAASQQHFDTRAMPSSIAVPRAAVVAPVDPSASSRNIAPVSSPPEPVEAPLPPPVVVEAPPPRPAPDRWQFLSDALARCPGDVIGRTTCQESLRIEHCQGFWGRVPACPARSDREYGN
jgi:hypothetical protein